EMRLARPWIIAMAVIDIILGVMYLPLGTGYIVIGAMLLVAESRLKRFLEGKANSLAAFAEQMKLYFLLSVMLTLAMVVFYFLLIFIYVGLVILFVVIFILLSASGKIPA
ncbi:MAG: hypothetical protein ACPL68_04825, partial [Candidatus Hydrothermia bacterium]